MPQELVGYAVNLATLSKKDVVEAHGILWVRAGVYALHRGFREEAMHDVEGNPLHPKTLLQSRQKIQFDHKKHL